MPITGLPSGRKVLLLDLLLALWAAAWIAAGVAVADTVGRLTALTGGFRSVGAAIEGSGRALGGVEIPLVGRPLAVPGRVVQEAGREISASGRAGEDEVEDASNLLGLTVALIPTLPLALLYLPPRLGRARETAAVRRMLAEDGTDPRLARFLAERAAQRVSYTRLRRLGARPWRDIDEGAHEVLAREELRRLGLRPDRLTAARQP